MKNRKLLQFANDSNTTWDIIKGPRNNISDNIICNPNATHCIVYCGDSYNSSECNSTKIECPYLSTNPSHCQYCEINCGEYGCNNVTINATSCNITAIFAEYNHSISNNSYIFAPRLSMTLDDAHYYEQNFIAIFGGPAYVTQHPEFNFTFWQDRQVANGYAVNAISNTVIYAEKWKNIYLVLTETDINNVTMTGADECWLQFYLYCSMMSDSTINVINTSWIDIYSGYNSLFVYNVIESFGESSYNEIYAESYYFSIFSNNEITIKNGRNHDSISLWIEDSSATENNTVHDHGHNSWIWVECIRNSDSYNNTFILGINSTFEYLLRRNSHEHGNTSINGSFASIVDITIKRNSQIEGSIIFCPLSNSSDRDRCIIYFDNTISSNNNHFFALNGIPSGLDLYIDADYLEDVYGDAGYDTLHCGSSWSDTCTISENWEDDEENCLCTIDIEIEKQIYIYYIHSGVNNLQLSVAEYASDLKNATIETINIVMNQDKFVDYCSNTTYSCSSEYDRLGYGWFPDTDGYDDWDGARVTSFEYCVILNDFMWDPQAHGCSQDEYGNTMYDATRYQEAEEFQTQEANKIAFGTFTLYATSSSGLNNYNEYLEAFLNTSNGTDAFIRILEYKFNEVCV